MKKKFRIVTFIVILAMLFPFTTFAANGGEDSNSGLINNVVNLEGQSKMTIYDMMLLPTKQGNQLVFKADIYNASNSELSFIYYWLRVHTKQGTRHDVKLVNESQGTTVEPKATRTYIYTALVDDQAKLSDISLQVIRWNFAIEGYEQRMGTVTITEDYNPTVSWERGKQISVENTPVKINGKKFLAFKKGNNYEVKVDLVMRNLGRFSVSIPNYSYYVQTADGLLYPATPAQSNLSILPNVEQEITLQSTIPSGVDMKGLQLVIVETIGQYDIPQMAIYLPSESSADEDDEKVSDVYVYETENGTYTLRLANMQRLPNNETDIISVEIEAINTTEDKALPNIQLVGTMELDGIQLEPEEIEGVRLDNNLNIKSGETVSFVFNAEIPYSFEFDEIKFKLSEKHSDGNSELVTFTNEFNQFEIKESSLITTNTIGKRSTVELLNSDRYSSDTSDILYADVIMTNIEPRFVNLEQLVAFYKLNGNVYFPAKIPDNKVLTMPSGQALIPISAKIPKGFDIQTVELVLGTQLKDKDSYKQAYLMTMSLSEHTVSEKLTDLKIGSSTISMSDTRLFINGGMGSLEFDYVLTKEVYQHELAEHKMRIAIVAGDKRFTSDIVLGKDLEVGEKKDVRVPINGYDLHTAIRGKGYTIEIYDVFEDGEKLLAVTPKDYSFYTDVAN